jgi:hypothetical protein
MPRRMTYLIAAPLVSLFFASSVLAAAPEWNFDNAPPGKIPSGWTAASGTWQIVAEPTSEGKRNVLAQVSSNHSGRYFNVAIANEPSLKDVTVTMRARAVAGREDQGGGPVWRYQNLRNYYIARYNPLEKNYRVYKVANGRRIQLGSADLTVPSGTWHELKVTMVGDHIQCFLDGKKYLDVRDNTFSGAGKVGLWTKADAQTQFDTFRVEGQ